MVFLVLQMTSIFQHKKHSLPGHVWMKSAKQTAVHPLKLSLFPATNSRLKKRNAPLACHQRVLVEDPSGQWKNGKKFCPSLENRCNCWSFRKAAPASFSHFIKNFAFHLLTPSFANVHVWSTFTFMSRTNHLNHLVWCRLPSWLWLLVLLLPEAGCCMAVHSSKISRCLVVRGQGLMSLI